MTTTARFSAAPSGGGGSSCSGSNSPTDSSQSAATSTQIIVLPTASLQNGSTIVNGVPATVLDVSALEHAAAGGDSSNNSSSQNVSDQTSQQQQQDNNQETPTQNSPHFIVTVGEGDTVTSHPGYQIQYVDPEMYAAASQTSAGQAQMAYPVYTVGETTTLYPAGQGQYYAATNATGTGTPAVSAVGYTTTPTAHYVVQQTVDTESLMTTASSRDSPTNLVNSETTPGTTYVTTSATTATVDDCNSPLGHATRVSPATVQWLLENYETADGVSLPRSTLYAHYLDHCGDNKLEPVNAASFGKLIRSVFLGLRTRRLGTRGNSKYHYYGIRVKPGSTLMNISEATNRVMLNATNNCGKAHGTVKPFKRNNQDYINGGCGGGGDGGVVPTVNNANNGAASAQYGDNNNSLMSHATYLGDGSNTIPAFPDIHFTEPLPDDCAYEDVDTLKAIYREHLEAFLDAILNLEFNTVETLWREFWRSQYNNNADECEEEKYLSKAKLFSLCTLSSVQEFMRQVDLAFYQNLIHVLVPDVLKPIPATLTQSIRNFAKNLESWLSGAMSGASAAMIAIKLSAVCAFGSSLRRYTSLNHLAQAARAVLHNSNQIAQMLNDLNRVDFQSVREQASWVCQCDIEIVSKLEADFKVTLQHQNSLEQWADWLKNTVTTALKPYEGKEGFTRAARQFLLKWSFYSSMVIRDLTLRSATSFGSFHLIRLLYDEYMFYLIEHQVAEATGVMPIATILDGLKEDKLTACYGPVEQDDYVNDNDDKLNCMSPTERIIKRQKFS